MKPTPIAHGPGVALAALGTLPFGAVLGPEAPVVALGSVVGVAATPVFGSAREDGRARRAPARSRRSRRSSAGPLVAGDAPRRGRDRHGDGAASPPRSGARRRGARLPHLRRARRLGRPRNARPRRARPTAVRRDACVRPDGRGCGRRPRRARRRRGRPARHAASTAWAGGSACRLCSAAGSRSGGSPCSRTRSARTRRTSSSPGRRRSRPSWRRTRRRSSSS